ncbi:MAG TPA: hypothetical protein ENK18_17080 [Deltaproteobacteria bacterium]|nr:hypothetical protein [Deltaproteobacteria bacterium]
MEPLIVGGLTGITAVVGVAFWQLMVRPNALLALWSDPSVPAEPWFEHHPGALQGLRWALGIVLFLSGFLTGHTLTFLLQT